MANITSKDIRNVVLLGHGGSGKTSLAEALLYCGNGSDRLGKISDGNSVCDYDPEEINRKFSLSAAIAPVIYNDKKINFIDTPGYLDFSAEVSQALRVVRNAVIVINAKSGVEVGAELAWDACTDAGVSKSFFINRMDEDNINFTNILNNMRELFGNTICPVFVPLFKDHKTVGFVDVIFMKAYSYDAQGNRHEIEFDPQAEFVVEYRQMVCEALAQTSDELMNKYFAEEPFTQEEIVDALNKGIKSGEIAPVFSGAATTMAGVRYLLDIISKSFPNPVDKAHDVGENGEEITFNTEGPASIFVFKTVADQFVGKMSYFKVMSGVLKKDDTLKNLTNGQTEKFARIYTIKGKKQTEVDSLVCGDIGVTAKLVATNTNDTLTAGGSEVQYKKIKFPSPFLCMGVTPKAKGDEDKISQGLTKLLEEDMSIKFKNNSETKQLLLYGLGEMHLDIITSKLKARFGTAVDLVPEKIAYRETIKKSVKVEGKHKKQSGGHGQYGHVKIEFSPGTTEGLEFSESIFGGSVPKNFHPAVEKGLVESMAKGVLAGYPVVGLKANLFDGSYHDVDSSEMAFKLAAGIAFRDGLKQASPVILEPVGNLKVLVPDALMGDIIGDVNKRRGKVLGMNPDEKKKGYSIIEAEVPQSEMGNYTVQLRAISQGRGSFSYEFDRYQEAPANVAQKIIEDAKKNEETA